MAGEEKDLPTVVSSCLETGLIIPVLGLDEMGVLFEVVAL